MTRRKLSLDSYLFFARANPTGSVLMITAFVLAGLMEGFGAASILSLLSILLDDTGADGTLEHAVKQAFAYFGTTPTLPGLLGLLIILAVARSLFTFFAIAQAGLTATQVTASLRLSMLRALLRARWTFFAHHSIGQSANALATEAQRASKVFLSGNHAFASFILIIFYALIAFLVSWQVSLMALLAGTLLSAGLAVFVNRARHAGERQTQSAKRLVANFTTAFSGFKAIKSMNRINYFAQMLEADMFRLRDAQRRQIIYQELLPNISEPLMLMIVGVSLYLALSFSDLSISELLVLGLVALRIMQRFSVCQSHIQRAAVAESALHSLLEARALAQKAREDNGGTIPPKLEHSLTLRNVSFSYPGQPVIRNISFKLMAPSFVALFGPSGSGKTTLLDMIIGLHQPQSGQVLLDSVSLENVDMQAWRRRIGYVPQDTYLFHDTVLNNIALGDKTIDAAKAQKALRAADAWEFVASLPQGLNTMVGEGGGRLSGGQRQRISIARAIATNPLLLVLDEATSALDQRSEEEILHTIRKIARSITVIAVSHNPAVAEAADTIIDLVALKSPPTPLGSNFASARLPKAGSIG